MLNIGEKAFIVAPTSLTQPELIDYIGTECQIIDYMVHDEVLIKHHDCTYSIIPRMWLIKEIPEEGWTEFCKRMDLSL